MEAEELAGVLIQFLHTAENQIRLGRVHPGNELGDTELWGYPNRDECRRAYAEAWAVLEQEGILARDPENTHGHCFITRKGKRIRTREEFNSFRLANMFPKESIHPGLLADTYPLFLRGQYEVAIFQAFKLVEVEVRGACPASMHNLLGQDLMTKAFKAGEGPLCESSEPASEQQALMYLFAGAIGRFKNPGSHRRVPNLTPSDAIEAILFASHLLRIVDQRRQRAQSPA